MIAMNKKSRAFPALVIAACLAVFATTGCTASRVVESATTKLQVTTSTGKQFALELPKELETENLDLTLETPDAGKIILKADKLKSSSQGIIQNAGQIQAETANTIARVAERALTIAAPVVTAAKGGSPPPEPEEPDPTP